MSKPPTVEQNSQFIILTCNVHGKLDAASVFSSPPTDAWKKAKLLAVNSQSEKFQIYAVQQNGSGSLTFSQVEKPRK